MGMDEHMIAVIKALAENRIQDAKNEAIVCCLNDTTKKNEYITDRLKKLLENGSINTYEVPLNVKGILTMQDVSSFNENRYYCGVLQRRLFSSIRDGVMITTKLLEYGIPYMNSTLIYGEPGTGKTEFAKYVAYKLNLPFAYLNFSHLIDSYMGKTSQNLQRVFDFCKGQKCVLMLDEIDCIGLKRGNDTGPDGELARTTISLMQALDSLVDGQIVIAATNRPDRLDEALVRRFQRKEEFRRFDSCEERLMIEAYINSVNASLINDSLYEYAKESHTQAETVKFLIDVIIKSILKEDRKDYS